MCNLIKSDGPDFQLQPSGICVSGNRLHLQQCRVQFRLTLSQCSSDVLHAGAAVVVSAFKTVHFSEWGDLPTFSFLNNLWVY